MEKTTLETFGKGAIAVGAAVGAALATDWLLKDIPIKDTFIKGGVTGAARKLAMGLTAAGMVRLLKL